MKRPSREINIFSLSALDLFASAMGVFILLALIALPYYRKLDPILVAENKQLKEQLTQCQSETQACQQNLTQCQQQTAQAQADATQARADATQAQAQAAQAQQQAQRCETARTQENQHRTELERQLGQCREQADQARARADSCEEKLKYTFVAIIIQWATQNQDVDLHVIDPAGNEFYYQKNNRNGSDFRGVEAELSVDSIHGPGVEAWQTGKAKPGLYKVYANLFNLHGNNQKPVIYSSVYYRDGGKKLPEVTLTRVSAEKDQLIATLEVKDSGEVIIH